VEWSVYSSITQEVYYKITTQLFSSWIPLYTMGRH